MLILKSSMNARQKRVLKQSNDKGPEDAGQKAAGTVFTANIKDSNIPLVFYHALLSLFILFFFIHMECLL